MTEPTFLNGLRVEASFERQHADHDHMGDSYSVGVKIEGVMSVRYQHDPDRRVSIMETLNGSGDSGEAAERLYELADRVHAAIMAAGVAAIARSNPDRAALRKLDPRRDLIAEVNDLRIGLKREQQKSERLTLQRDELRRIFNPPEVMLTGAGRTLEPPGTRLLTDEPPAS